MVLPEEFSAICVLSIQLLHLSPLCINFVLSHICTKDLVDIFFFLPNMCNFYSVRIFHFFKMNVCVTRVHVRRGSSWASGVTWTRPAGRCWESWVSVPTMKWPRSLSSSSQKCEENRPSHSRTRAKTLCQGVRTSHLPPSEGRRHHVVPVVPAVMGKDMLLQVNSPQDSELTTLRHGWRLHCVMKRCHGPPSDHPREITNVQGNQT